MNKIDVLEQLQGEIIATRELITELQSDNLESADDTDFQLKEAQSYLDELKDDFEITQETLTEAELKEAERAEQLESDTEGLAIVVGHTKTRPGAKGVAPPFPTTSPAACHEYAWNKDLAQIIKVKADAVSIRCEIFYRDIGGVAGAYARVRQWGPEATIELHFNAFNAKTQGTETLFALPRSKALASELQKQMVALYNRSGKQNRGLRDRSSGGRGRLSLTQIDPSVLIEPFFGDAAKDAAIGEELKSQLADTILSSFGIWQVDSARLS